MKISRTRLKQIIKEELANVFQEEDPDRRIASTFLPPDPEARRRGKQAWQLLESELAPYIDVWDLPENVLEPAHPETPVIVLDQATSLLSKVIGFDGWWRTAVYSNWIGCERNPEIETCRKFMKHGEAAWPRIDQLIKDMESAVEKDNTRAAKRFIAKYNKKILKTIEFYTPSSKSASRARSTKFGMLIGLGGGGGIGDDDDDL